MYSTIEYVLRTGSDQRRQSFGKKDETDCSDQCGQYEYYRIRNLTSEVEGEVQTNYGDKHNVEGDDEHEVNDENVCEEAPNDPDIRIRQPLGVNSSTPCRLGCLRSTPTANK